MPTHNVIVEHKTFIQGPHRLKQVSQSDLPELEQLQEYLNTKYFNGLKLNTVQELNPVYRHDSVPIHRIGGNYLIIWEAD